MLNEELLVKLNTYKQELATLRQSFFYNENEIKKKLNDLQEKLKNLEKELK